MLLFLGILFGSFAPADDWWRSRAFRAGTIAVIAFTIVAFVSYAVAPDWMWMYFLDPGDVAWILPGLAVAYPATFLVGFAAAVGLQPLGTRTRAGLAVGMIVGEIGVIGLTWSRYHLVGTRAEWLRGDAHELFSISPSGPVKTIGILVPLFFVVLAATLVYVRRASRLLPRR